MISAIKVAFSFPHATSFRSGPPPLTSCPCSSSWIGRTERQKHLRIHPVIARLLSRATRPDDTVAFAVRENRPHSAHACGLRMEAGALLRPCHLRRPLNIGAPGPTGPKHHGHTPGAARPRSFLLLKKNAQ